jgi:hypothetical protein
MTVLVEGRILYSYLKIRIFLGERHYSNIYPWDSNLFWDSLFLSFAIFLVFGQSWKLYVTGVLCALCHAGKCTEDENVVVHDSAVTINRKQKLLSSLSPIL